MTNYAKTKRIQSHVIPTFNDFTNILKTLQYRAIIKAEGLLKVTGSHVHYKCGRISAS